MKGLKHVLSVALDKNSAVVPKNEVGKVIQSIWQMICDGGNIMNLLTEKGTLILRLLADCLAMIDYHVTCFDPHVSFNVYCEECQMWPG